MEKFLCIVIGLLLIGSSPSLFNGIHLDFASYLSALADLMKNLASPWLLTYNDLGTTRPLFPAILSPWLHSLLTLFLSFIIACLIALVLTYLTLLLPGRFINAVRFVLFILEAIPDVVILAAMQIGVIYIYQKTHLLLFNVAAYNDQPIFLPVFVLSLLPVIMLYRMMLIDFIEESEKPYVELAKGKGMPPRTVLLGHIFRNALVRIFSETKYIFWFMLSNLLVIEYVFNIFGLTNFMLKYPSNVTFTVGLLLFFVPIFLVLSVCQLVIAKVTKERMDLV
ncbi:ABC transporter permease subunit [Caenibacillus caldisaponilyticus]|uniref:ABC transporter permease subunit n=1 Tax=Caenibacillus caldisaponilyticus TaxID=1674942 RepID=UPI0009888E5C|nr:ABC transporter permease subunit [Caenibacillus caldisaponilyticus]